MEQQKVSLDRQKGRSLLWTLIIAGLVTTMNTTTVSIALPSYMQIFHVDLATVQWVVVGYMLPLGMMMPLSGYLGERLGYRRAFLLMMAAIGVCSLGCALAWNFQALVFWRVLKGVAAGIVTPYSMSLLYRYIGHDLQPHYLGIATDDPVLRRGGRTGTFWAAAAIRLLAHPLFGQPAAGGAGDLGRAAYPAQRKRRQDAGTYRSSRDTLSDSGDRGRPGGLHLFRKLGRGAARFFGARSWAEQHWSSSSLSVSCTQRILCSILRYSAIGPLP